MADVNESIPPRQEPDTLWTIGHSNRAMEDFLGMLRSCAIALVADVRRFAGSRRQPQFGREHLEEALGAAGIGYRHLADLGGRRKSRLPDSPNRGWRVASFNAYADYMLTAEFQAALAELEELARSQATAIMCAEAVPWRCHRRLIADALVTRGWNVLDIYGVGRVKEHRLTEFAQVDDGRITYPAANS